MMSHLPEHLCPLFHPPPFLLPPVFHLKIYCCACVFICFYCLRSIFHFALGFYFFGFYLFAQDLCHMQEDRACRNIFARTHTHTHAHTCGSHTQPKGVCVRARYEYVCVHYVERGGGVEFFCVFCNCGNVPQLWTGI